MQPNNEVMGSMISDAVSYQQLGGRSDTMRSMKPIASPPQQQNAMFRQSSIVSFHSEKSAGSANSQESANFGGINLKNLAKESDKTPTTQIESNQDTFTKRSQSRNLSSNTMKALTTPTKTSNGGSRRLTDKSLGLEDEEDEHMNSLTNFAAENLDALSNNSNGPKDSKPEGKLTIKEEINIY